ncbi:unnamed protein product (macronuclear) [Paramecium tetraurelia]|uniref:40S ribosomal protein S2 n=1 Tax=Paramecium tetraurelia TaxID=5888 RepID=A0E2R7_PARTE|nr:uncharacterized protein GSPATT00022756001 [Paramecium tetraurelia]CAK89584.1 unnamed protein product [Paramecium tetraurelia]|eukprot:XP_001456981.1 hypothetical protein (macronuclear) [Paramecium tetraurelia strain d4-2]
MHIFLFQWQNKSNNRHLLQNNNKRQPQLRRKDFGRGGRGQRERREGGAPRQNRGPRRFGGEQEWVPLTKLGRLVKGGKIKSLETIFQFSIPIKEYQIVDHFLKTLKEEPLAIGPVQKQTCAGQKTRFKAYVVVGDSHQHIGLGWKSAKEVQGAIQELCNLNQCQTQFDSSQKRILGKQDRLTTHSPMQSDRKGRISQSQIGSSTQRYWYSCSHHIQEGLTNGWYPRLLHSIQRKYKNQIKLLESNLPCPQRNLQFPNPRSLGTHQIRINTILRTQRILGCLKMRQYCNQYIIMDVYYFSIFYHMKMLFSLGLQLEISLEGIEEQNTQ